MIKTDCLNLTIGKIQLQLDFLNLPLLIEAENLSVLHNFISENDFTVSPDYKLTLQVRVLAGDYLESVYDPQPHSWFFQRSADFCELYFRPPLVEGGWTHYLGLDLKNQTGEIKFVLPVSSSKTGVTYAELFPAFLDKFIFTTVLDYLGGCFIHSAALAHNGQGYLFSGASGVGKSTISRLWLKQGGARVVGLTDECCMIRHLPDHNFWIFGTPWHSLAKIAHPAGAPLTGLYFLKHAKDNKTTLLNSTETLARLLGQSQLAAWDSAAVANGLAILIKLAQTISGYELGFVPDERVIDFLQSATVAR
jgi:hypothetical protein